ncbi:amino acid ABC transporter permease [Neomegalonema perideroedes]|uniref:amino acid ABC transporter permease n=1 Tax=Neomegalonema perideroedes TaxID=217219 RepID=UPI00036A5761|nr:amino acid ABC transporter permease [Neomegalonema perideroedes]
MDVALIQRIAPFILEAALKTMQLAAASLAIGLAAAVALVAARMSRQAIWRGLSAAYVSVIRGTPLLVQLFLVFFGGPQLGLNLTPFQAGAITMGLNIGAYMSVGLHGAIIAVEHGQYEAARSLGFGRLDTMRLFILPQAAPLMLRTLGVNTVILTKGTALASTIGVVELTYSAQRFVTSTYKPFEVFAAAGIAYLIIILAIMLGIRGLESLFGTAERGRV